MIPKWSQNLSKIDPGQALEATWEPPLKQGASKFSSLIILPPFWDPLGTSLGSFWASFFWCFFEVAFWWSWPPFGLPKHIENETQKGVKTKSWNSSILLLFTRFGHIKGCWKWSFFAFFGTLFWEGFGSPCSWIWLTFGVPFGDHVGHFWGTIFALIFRPPKNIKKNQGVQTCLSMGTGSALQC